MSAYSQNQPWNFPFDTFNAHGGRESPELFLWHFPCKWWTNKTWQNAHLFCLTASTLELSWAEMNFQHHLSLFLQKYIDQERRNTAKTRHHMDSTWPLLIPILHLSCNSYGSVMHNFSFGNDHATQLWHLYTIHNIVMGNSN